MNPEENMCSWFSELGTGFARDQVSARVNERGGGWEGNWGQDALALTSAMEKGTSRGHFSIPSVSSEASVFFMDAEVDQVNPNAHAGSVVPFQPAHSKGTLLQYSFSWYHTHFSNLKINLFFHNKGFAVQLLVKVGSPVQPHLNSATFCQYTVHW